MPSQHRQLAAILFTDIVGYSGIMQKDEQAAIVIYQQYMTVLKQFVTAYHGRILNDYGDGSLCAFPSAIEAVQCAVEIQKELQNQPKVPLRIGLHVGEVIFEGRKAIGDSVNIASRIQSLGQANTILFSKEVFDKLRNQPGFNCVSLGQFEFKNVDEPMEIFALAKEGLVVPRKEEMSGKLKERQKKSSPVKWFIAVIALLLLTASFFIYRNLTREKGFSGGDKTIAVLPFENVGADNSEEYVSDGITQDIINSLSKISSLQKVIGWFSVRSYKKTTKPLKQIAAELGVTAILSGTMQKRDGKTRIITELIEVSSNKRLWGDDFEYEAKELLSIYSRVAGEIVTHLKATVTPEEEKTLFKHYTENVEAYKFYLRGRSFWNASGRENVDSAESNYKKAIELEPNYALAYAGLADCYAVNYKGLSQLEQVPIAKMYVKKALSLDSTLSEALTTQGFIQQNFDYNWEEARKNLKKAVNLNPNNTAAHLYYGLVLIHSTSDKEGALREMEKAVDLDPLSYISNWILARNYYFTGKYELAIKQFKRMILFIPKGLKYIPVWSIGLVYLKKNLYPEARGEFNQLPEGNDNQIDNYQVMQSYAYAVMGETEKALTLLQKTLKEYPALSYYRNSQVYVALGNFDQAMVQLELGFVNRDVHMFWIGVDPAFDPIRNDQRFKNLLKRMNLR